MKQRVGVRAQGNEEHIGTGVYKSGDAGEVWLQGHAAVVEIVADGIRCVKCGEGIVVVCDLRWVGGRSILSVAIVVRRRGNGGGGTR